MNFVLHKLTSVSDIGKYALVCIAIVLWAEGAGELVHVSIRLFFTASMLFLAGLTLVMRKDSPRRLRWLGFVALMPCVIEGFFWLTCHYSIQGAPLPWGGLG